jgi:hypothetical protein
MDLPLNNKAYPFKMNAQWLNDQEFVDLVHKVWKDPGFMSESSKQARIIWKLKVLKAQAKIWYREKLAKNNEKLLSLESTIKEAIIELAAILQTLERNCRSDLWKGKEIRS